MVSVQAEVMVQLHVRAKEFKQKLIVHDMTAGCLVNVWQPMEKHNKINISLYNCTASDLPFHLCMCVTKLDICKQIVCRIIQ